MAITSMDQFYAGLLHIPRVYGKDAVTAEQAGIPHTPWYTAGVTGAGAAPTGGLNGATFSASVSGAITVPTGVTSENSYLSKITAVQTGNIGGLWLIDRIWGNVPVVTTTGAQAVTSPTWPARDETASTNGAGVLLALEVSSTTGNAGTITNTTVSYTNSAGTAGRTATLASFPITGLTGTWVLFSLQAGDVGVRSVQSITLGTSYVSGVIHLMAFRLICELETPTANIPARASFTSLNAPVVWDLSVPQLVYWPTSTALGSVYGSLWFAQG